MQKTIHSGQYATFLQILRNTRRQARLTQIEVAARIHETQSFERGERRVDIVEVRTFCEAFGVSFEKFAATFDAAVRPKPSIRRRRSG
jgi:transcriptional regulator with XRE-family HTH domain